MDDEQSARSAITRILEREGHEVLDFADAAPALEEVDYATVDLVLTPDVLDVQDIVRKPFSAAQFAETVTALLSS